MTKYSTKTLMLIPVFAIVMIAGTATQVMAIGDNDDASVKIRALELKNQGFYEVRLLISSGNEDLAAGKILVTSDASSKEVNFDAVLAESTTDVRTVIKVNDRSSVDAKLINIDDKPTAKITGVILFDGRDANLYTATVKVSTGSEAIQNVKLLFESDMESLSVSASPARNNNGERIFSAYSDGLTTIKIHAIDSESIIVSCGTCRD